MTSINKAFRKSLYSPDEFTLTFELVPSRSGRGKGQNRILKFAAEAAKDGRIKAVSITENAGGHPALSPEVLGLEIGKMGLAVINHFSCKDKNRNQIESLLFAWEREGYNNLLILSGDYPKAGYLGHPKPVFDLGSIQTLDLISRMNSESIGKQTPESANLPHSDLFLKGVAVSPFKLLESELHLQYMKLKRKIRAGADYIITQLGFDARKFHEILLYLQQNNLSVPILGNLFIPNLPVARIMHKGEVPGCIVTDSLLDLMEKEAEAPDKGKKARLIRAAKLLAILKGLGFSGAHMGGPGLLFSDVAYVMDKAEDFQNWRQHITDLSFWPNDGFYYFNKDSESGLNLPTENISVSKAGPKRSIHYAISKKIHDLMFSPEGRLFQPMKKVCFTLEDHGLESILDKFEFFMKLLMYDCRNCGDCRLSELAYLCPQSGCAKFLLNGPCGGSLNGWCEVYPKKKRCFYVRIFERLSRQELEAWFAGKQLAPRDWSKNMSSSWLHFFHEHDEG